MQAHTLEIKDFLHITYLCIKALRAFHGEARYRYPSFIHRDVKLDNFRVACDETGKVTQLWLVDFGLARELRGHITTQGRTLGGYLMPHSRSPLKHQFWGQCDMIYRQNAHKFPRELRPEPKAPFDLNWTPGESCDHFHYGIDNDFYALGAVLWIAATCDLDGDRSAVIPALNLIALACVPKAPLPSAWVEKTLQSTEDCPAKDLIRQLKATIQQVIELYFTQFLPVAAKLYSGDATEKAAAEEELQRLYLSFSIREGRPTFELLSSGPDLAANTGSNSGSSASASSANPSSAASSSSSNTAAASATADDHPQLATVAVVTGLTTTGSKLASLAPQCY